MMDIEGFLSDLRRDEGLKLSPYYCTAGKLSIGYGRNLEDRGITKEEAEYLLNNDRKAVFEELDKHLLFWRGLSENRQKAIANMAFQLGVTRLLGFSKMLSAMKYGNFKEAAKEVLNSKYAAQAPARANRVAELIRNG